MRYLFTVVLAGFLVTGFQADVKAAQIGSAKKITNQVTATRGNAPRRLGRGDGIFQNEMIRTAAKSLAQLRFNDGTSLTVGAKSVVRMDAFVYNPNTKSGKIVINTLKGAFRFVSGSARKSAYRLKTSVATIGIRGTTIHGYAGRGIGVFILGKGGMQVCSSTGCRMVTKKNDYVVVKANGSISMPKQWRKKPHNIPFSTQFPVRTGRFSADPGSFENLGTPDDSSGEDNSSSSSGSYN